MSVYPVNKLTGYNSVYPVNKLTGYNSVYPVNSLTCHNSVYPVNKLTGHNSVCPVNRLIAARSAPAELKCPGRQRMGADGGVRVVLNNLLHLPRTKSKSMVIKWIVSYDFPVAAAVGRKRDPI